MFMMTKRLDESLASPQSPRGDTDQSPAHKSGITFAAQETLPKLPIPDLDDTCKKYIDALRPLQNKREQEDTAIAVQEFLESDGPELQARLKKYAAGKISYIEQFWYDSYLHFDNSVVLNLNPFFLFEDDPSPARENQVDRAASLVISALSFVRAVRKEELPPDMLRGIPLCMYQYSRLFGTARVPTYNGCQITQDPGAKHIVVICRGQFYWFDVLDDASDLVMTEKDIALNLQIIVEDAEQIPIQEAAKGALGVLTTENRKTWARLRDVLTRDLNSNNSECLSTIDSALFILCLDHTTPKTGAALCGNMLCGTSEVVKGIQIGTCTNRWYDKMQILVCKNGSAGINFEHTGVDGHTVLRMASDVYADTILRFAKTINGQSPSLWASTSPNPSARDPESFGDVITTPHKLEWDMLPELGTALRFAEARLADLIQQNEFETLDFTGYGKTFITSVGFSPDAFVQMAFQAAYYGLYGRVESTYEPAMTKVFLHGRTEAIRVATPESSKFVQTFWAENPPQQKIETLKRAVEKHTSITKECGKALGQDRHLYALYCIWQRAINDEGAEAASSSGASSTGHSSATGANPEDNRASNVDSPKRNSVVSNVGSDSIKVPSKQIPALFADAGWDLINTTILSTSNCGNPCLRQFGFGPTSADGFGIGYIIKTNSIAICASSKHRQTRRFVDAIESYFLEIRRLLRSTTRASSSLTENPVKEIERKPVAGGRVKKKGRAITSDSEKAPTARKLNPDINGNENDEDDDDGLGGYGFFDAGMLLQALKADQDDSDEGGVHGRRALGKKVRLNEY